MAYTCAVYNYWLNAAWKEYIPTLTTLSDHNLSLLSSAGSLSNSIFRLLAGIVVNKYPFKWIFLANITVAILSSLSINYVLNGYALAFAYVVAAFGGIGVHLTIFPSICATVFHNGHRVYPYVFLMFSLASLSQYLILYLCNDDYPLMLHIFTGISIVGGIGGMGGVGRGGKGGERLIDGG